jgi:hypothetical protein
MQYFTKGFWLDMLIQTVHVISAPVPCLRVLV